MPRKPSRPVGHIVFPKSGAPYPVVEALPESKDELERVIAQKFVDALRERFNRELDSPRRGDTWPDFWTHEAGRQIGLEVVEIVNPELAAQGRAYRENLPVDVGRARRLLTEAIRAKIAKRYQRLSTASLWLLAYDVTSALVAQHDAAAREANAHLQTVEHPFSEIWLMWPTTGEVPSFLESVWPSTGFTSTGRRP